MYSASTGYLSHVPSDYVLHRNLNLNGLHYNCVILYDKYNVSMIDYIYDVHYAYGVKKHITAHTAPDGVRHSYLLSSPISNRHSIVNLLHKPYWALLINIVATLCDVFMMYIFIVSNIYYAFNIFIYHIISLSSLPR